MSTVSGEGAFPPVEVHVERVRDGLILRNAIALREREETLPERLAYWAGVAPDRVFLSEVVEGVRKTLTYAEGFAQARGRAACLLAYGLDAEHPLMIVAGNGIEHALWMLGATLAGIPVSIVSPAYAMPAAAPYAKLAHLAALMTPGLVLADGVSADALQTLSGLQVERLDEFAPASESLPNGMLPLIDGATVAKLLFTSGSTGTPKAVPNTQRMMVSNMQALERVWPFLSERPPVLVDWLPWNHTFGGNCCFNIALYFGGTLHIDHGKPVQALIGRTVTALRTIAPTAYFNVPAGYAALLPWLEEDASLAETFFSRLDMLFNAAATLPESTRSRLEAAARRAIGRVPPILGGWGSTETAPFSTVIYFPTSHAANLGVPLPGTEIKMVDSDGRKELRVRGPNVMPGYWRQPDANTAAFDADGFYRIGDAAVFAENGKPESGFVFDGRIAENFKLSSGTWVNVSALRLAVTAATDPVVADVVVAGEGRPEIGILVFPNLEACRKLAADPAGDVSATLSDPAVQEVLYRGIARYNASQVGPSTQVRFVHVLPDAPSAEAGEITDKGYLNQGTVLRHRAEAVEVLFRSGHLPLS
ncbi:AMP-binding protein [Sphingosinicella sp.]|uniref:AMP-binding protein n=1 Tax=Sphingosinicella sp. TaxID=1917971 RepID=UPI0035AE08A8